MSIPVFQPPRHPVLNSSADVAMLTLEQMGFRYDERTRQGLENDFGELTAKAAKAGVKGELFPSIPVDLRTNLQLIQALDGAYSPKPSDYEEKTDVRRPEVWTPSGDLDLYARTTLTSPGKITARMAVRACGDTGNFDPREPLLHFLDQSFDSQTEGQRSQLEELADWKIAHADLFAGALSVRDLIVIAIMRKVSGQDLPIESLNLPGEGALRYAYHHLLDATLPRVAVEEGMFYKLDMFTHSKRPIGVPSAISIGNKLILGLKSGLHYSGTGETVNNITDNTDSRDGIGLTVGLE